ncbi:MAG: cytidine deaminase [Lentimicrobiaceae bacterium]
MIKHTLTLAYTEVSEISQLSEEDQKLLQDAWEASDSAYAPYSNFRVGAALRLANNLTVKGNNQENAAYPSGICAERVAIFSASAMYPGVTIKSIAVVAKTDVFQLEDPVTPCGACRQVISEYEMLSGQPIRIILQGNSRKVWIIEGITNLLPLMFRGVALKK